MNDRQGGYIKLHRQLLSSPVWRMLRGDQRSVLIEILFLANWKPGTAYWHGRPYEVGRGELAHTLETIARGRGDEEGLGAGVTIKVVRTTIALLLKDHGNGPFLIERYPLAGTGSGTGPRVLKVVNYDKFQDVPDESGHGVGHGRGTAGAQIEEGEEGEEKKQARRAEPLLLLDQPPIPKPRPQASTSLGRFIAQVWPDVEDPDDLEARLRAAHPQVDLLAEARKAYAWEASQPPSARKKAHARFLTMWVARARPTLAEAASPAAAPRRLFEGLDPATGRPRYREGG